MLSKILVYTITIALLLGFTSVSDQLKVQMGHMPQHYSHFDAKLGWVINADKNVTKISGIFQNSRYALMENIEVWVSVLDDNGKVSVRSVDYIIPDRLARDDFAPFSVTLPIVTSATTKFLFTYKYNGSDGGENGGSNNWMQSFETSPGSS